MFTGLITGVGTVREVQPIGDGKDARFTIEIPANEDWQAANDQARRLDRLFRLLPDRDCARRGFFRRRGLGRDAVAHHARRLEAGEQNQPGSLAAPGRRAGRPSRLRPCRRARHGAVRNAGKRLHPLAFSTARHLAPSSHRKAASPSMACPSRSMRSRGRNLASTSFRTPPTHTNFGAGGGRAGQYRNRYAGALCRAAIEFSACIDI